MLTVESGDHGLSRLISHLEPRRLWWSLGEPGGRGGSKLDQDRNCALRLSNGLIADPCHSLLIAERAHRFGAESRPEEPLFLQDR